MIQWCLYRLTVESSDSALVMVIFLYTFSSYSSRSFFLPSLTGIHSLDSIYLPLFPSYHFFLFASVVISLSVILLFVFFSSSTLCFSFSVCACVRVCQCLMIRPHLYPIIVTLAFSPQNKTLLIKKKKDISSFLSLYWLFHYHYCIFHGLGYSTIY